MEIETGFRINMAELLGYFLTFLPNVYIASHQNDVGGILFVLWSIGIEVQFYLAIPLVIMAFPKHIVKVLFALILLHIVATHQFPSIAWHNFNYYYFLFGGIISILSVQGNMTILKHKWISLNLLLLFILLFFANVVVIRNDIIYYLFTSFVASLFICSIADFPLLEIRNRSLYYLGEIAYEFYMYHMICITAILYIFPKLHSIFNINSFFSLLFINLSAILLTIIVAHLSFQKIEKFFTKRRGFTGMKQLPA
jgi:peptidoglycan/LPS O-acetylase OafA/YrhL